MNIKPDKASSRRGVAIIAFVVALLIIGTFSLLLFHVTASTATSFMNHYYSTGAFYGAESGMEMAMRELNQGNDFDSDGTIGTISDNGNPADDPALATGRVFVQQTSTSPPLYQATGRPALSTAPWSAYRRIIEARVE